MYTTQIISLIQNVLVLLVLEWTKYFSIPTESHEGHLVHETCLDCIVCTLEYCDWRKRPLHVLWR